jgi:hypothetical protein
MGFTPVGTKAQSKGDVVAGFGPPADRRMFAQHAQEVRRFRARILTRLKDGSIDLSEILRLPTPMT